MQEIVVCVVRTRRTRRVRRAFRSGWRATQHTGLGLRIFGVAQGAALAQGM
jgi:hypothetical protein